VSRFLLSRHAERDLDDILSYLDSIPDKPALRIASSIRQALKSVASHPYRGVIQSELTRLAGIEVRSRLVNSYRIIYTVGASASEIVGVLHTARDIGDIMAERLQ
jgi:plasmid stabilization system protein ParE